MTVTDFDQMPAPWASQGPALYVQGRMHRHGDWPVDKVLDEYYAGFGRAEAEVRAYFAHWEQVTYSDVTEQAYRAGPKSPLVIPPITDNPEHRLYRWSELFITDDDLAKGRALLEKARLVQPDIDLRFPVFRSLREKGVRVKTGFKYGTHFRAYSSDPNRTHADFLVHVYPDDARVDWQEISRGIRVAHGVNKRILFSSPAMVEKNEFMELTWVRP